MTEQEIKNIIKNGKDIRGCKPFSLNPLYPIKERDKEGRIVWHCICDCGTELNVTGRDVTSGRKKDCGCNKDYCKRVFGNWTVLEKVDNTYDKYKCKCKCGNIKIVNIKNLKNGRSTSCGCSRKENLKGRYYKNWYVLEESNKRTDGGALLWKCQCIKCKKIEYKTKRTLQESPLDSCRDCVRKEHGGVLPQKIKLDIKDKEFGKLVALYPLEDIRANNGSIIWHCKCECGNEIDVPRSSLILGFVKSCGCLKSKGELKIKKFLQENNIKFETQKTFNSCRFPETNALARFDFYLPDYNILIEYDGEQHFRANGYGWNTKENLKKTQERDNFKNQWCKDNNITLIRIPYTHYNNLCLEDLFIFGQNS